MTIAIDPGHGYCNRRPGVYDPGAEEGGVAEADVALALGLSLSWVLRQRGYQTWMTRDDDRDPDPVGARDDRAEAAGADVFVSLHCNSAEAADARGTETYYRDERDKRLAVWVNNNVAACLRTTNRGIKREDLSQHSRLAIFDFDGPACLVELGFLSNPSERALLQSVLTSRDARLRLAQAIAAGIDGWRTAWGGAL